MYSNIILYWFSQIWLHFPQSHGLQSVCIKKKHLPEFSKKRMTFLDIYIPYSTIKVHPELAILVLNINVCVCLRFLKPVYFGSLHQQVVSC